MKIHRSGEQISLSYLQGKETNIRSRNLDGVIADLNTCLEWRVLIPIFISEIPKYLTGHNENKMFWACSLDPAVIEKSQLEISPCVHHIWSIKITIWMNKKEN